MTKRFDTSEHPEFFKPTICKNCGKEIFYSPWDTLHFHVEYERWEDENGYYCSEGSKQWAEPDSFLSPKGMWDCECGYSMFEPMTHCVKCGRAKP